MPLKVKMLTLLSVVILLFIAVAWIKDDLEAWGDVVLVADEPKHVVIKSGDTIWDIARQEYGGAETGRWVYEICQLNPGIDPGRLQPGQKVRLP